MPSALRSAATGNGAPEAWLDALPTLHLVNEWHVGHLAGLDGVPHGSVEGDVILEHWKQPSWGIAGRMSRSPAMVASTGGKLKLSFLVLVPPRVSARPTPARSEQHDHRESILAG